MKKILIVDDNTQNLYMADVLFSGNGYNVETAANGKDALEKAMVNPPDLILADILMPIMDGFALCREWQSTETLRKIPFVFYTATYTDPEDEKFALSLGAHSFLVKPVAADVLITIIENILNEAETGQTDQFSIQQPEEKVYLKQYNQTLVHKLEDKLMQLEEANKKLEREIKGRQYAEQKLYNFEKKLVQLQKMEALGTLAGGIAHDFNNILMAIMGNAEIALLNNRDGITEEKSLEQVLQACNRAKDLVNQILTFSRQSEMDRKPLRVSIIVKEVLKLLASALPPDIEIKEKYESDSLIIANQTQIYQVLMNLCTNASHAIGDRSGTIEVRLSDVIVGEESKDILLQELSPGQYQKLEVIDNGSGIEKEMIKQIFDPYFTTKQKDGGTGLGLSVVQGIVKDSGGIITVQSSRGEGTVFSLYFPVFISSDENDFPKPVSYRGGTESILFVDDEPTLIDIGVQMLKRLGYSVTAISESRKALHLFKERPRDFDLVICDMDMPGLTGDKLASGIINIRNDIPIMLCTGFSDMITEQMAVELGIKAFLMKPFVLEALSNTIRNVLDNN